MRGPCTTPRSIALRKSTSLYIAPRRFQIAQGCEADHQVFLGIGKRGQCAVLVGLAQDLRLEVGPIAENMRMRVDQAGQYGRATQIDDFATRRNLDRLGRADFGNSVALDQDNLVRRKLVCPSEEPSRPDCNPVIGRGRSSAPRRVRRPAAET